MPYWISSDQADCDGWATLLEKDDGTYEMLACHTSKEDAVAHMVAASINTDGKAMGQLNSIRSVRAVNLEPPAYMRAAAKRGVELHEEGFSGDGVRPQTVEDARKMAAGTVTEDKWRRIGPWIARHLVDLDAVQGDEITPGLVAHLLWGSGPSKADARRAMEYANDVVGRLEEEREVMNDNEQNTYHDQDEDNSHVDKRELPSSYRPANSEDVPEGRSCGNCYFFDQERSFCLKWDAGCDPDYYCDAWKAISTEVVADEVVDEVEDSGMMADEELASNRNRWVVTTNNKRSIAYSNLSIRAEGDGKTLVGYAAVFDSPSEPLPWTEFVRRGAFAKTINDGADVRLLVDHEGVPLARTKSGTLRIREDDKGLRVEADLDETNPDAARVMSALRRGDVSQMSFAFEPVKDSWSSDKKTRELKEVKLFDVSVVTYPAYEETMVQLRNTQANNTDTTTVKTSSLALRRAQIAIQRTSRAVQQPTE
jgi:uncharacterized protein